MLCGGPTRLCKRQPHNHNISGSLRRGCTSQWGNPDNCLGRLLPLYCCMCPEGRGSPYHTAPGSSNLQGISWPILDHPNRFCSSRNLAGKLCQNHTASTLSRVYSPCPRLYRNQDHIVCTCCPGWCDKRREVPRYSSTPVPPGTCRGWFPGPVCHRYFQPGNSGRGDNHGISQFHHKVYPRGNQYVLLHQGSTSWWDTYQPSWTGPDTSHRSHTK